LPDPSHHLKIKNKKGDRLFFLRQKRGKKGDRLLFLDGSGLSLGSGFASGKKNFPAIDYPWGQVLPSR